MSDYESTSAPIPRPGGLAARATAQPAAGYLAGLNPEQRQAVEATDGPVLGSAACHCRDCQYVSGGAPAYVFVVPRSSLKITRGQTKVYWSEADSGARRGRHFCGDCGTPLLAENVSYPDVLTVKAGTLDDPSKFKITGHFWAGSAPAWHCFTAGVPKLEKGPEA